MDDVTVAENYCLKAYNTLALAQRARYCITVASEAELLEALAFAHSHRLPVVMLGEGSNVILSCDLDAVVILNRLKGIRVIAQDADSVSVEVAAGENWHAFVQHALQQHWYGIENLALIPGTVGAAPVQNIGAYGVEVRQYLQSVRAWDTQLQQWVSLDNVQCSFAYRDSTFKQQPGRYLISAVQLRLLRHAVPQVAYQALHDYLRQHDIEAATATPQQVFDAVAAIRRARLPDPRAMPNAGSFFKNPIVALAQYEALQKKYPDLVSYAVDAQQRKLAAAWLIDRAGWKGRHHGNVAVHRQQALVLLNTGNATGAEMLEFAAQIQTDIRQRYGVELELEPVVL